MLNRSQTLAKECTVRTTQHTQTIEQRGSRENRGDTGRTEGIQGEQRGYRENRGNTARIEGIQREQRGYRGN